MIGSYHAWRSKDTTPEVTLRRSINKLAVVTFMLCGLGWQADPAFAKTSHAASNTAQQPAASARDGEHDFDFNIGVWHTHIRRIPDPFSAPDNSTELNGTVTVRKVWDGHAQLEEIEADGPNGHWEGLTVFLYNPPSHQSSQSFIDSKMAALNSPEIGVFHDGRGELFSQDTFKGKSILVRAVWSNIAPDSHRFEEFYSNDGGKTWAAAFIAELTREKQAATAAKMVRTSATAESADAEHAAAEKGQRDF